MVIKNAADVTLRRSLRSGRFLLRGGGGLLRGGRRGVDLLQVHGAVVASGAVVRVVRGRLGLLEESLQTGLLGELAHEALVGALERPAVPVPLLDALAGVEGQDPLREGVGALLLVEQGHGALVGPLPLGNQLLEARTTTGGRRLAHDVLGLLEGHAVQVLGGAGQHGLHDRQRDVRVGVRKDAGVLARGQEAGVVLVQGHPHQLALLLDALVRVLEPEHGLEAEGLERRDLHVLDLTHAQVVPADAAAPGLEEVSLDGGPALAHQEDAQGPALVVHPGDGTGLPVQTRVLAAEATQDESAGRRLFQVDLVVEAPHRQQATLVVVGHRHVDVALGRVGQPGGATLDATSHLAVQIVDDRHEVLVRAGVQVGVGGVPGLDGLLVRECHEDELVAGVVLAVGGELGGHLALLDPKGVGTDVSHAQAEVAGGGVALGDVLHETTGAVEVDQAVAFDHLLAAAFHHLRDADGGVVLETHVARGGNQLGVSATLGGDLGDVEQDGAAVGLRAQGPEVHEAEPGDVAIHAERANQQDVAHEGLAGLLRELLPAALLPALAVLVGDADPVAEHVGDHGDQRLDDAVEGGAAASANELGVFGGHC